MITIATMETPIGKVTMASKQHQLVGLWIEGQKYFLAKYKEDFVEDETEPCLCETRKWLQSYFQGEKPSFKELPLAPEGTKFQRSVWELLCKIDYGKTVTYRDLAVEIARQKGIKSMSAQAVGSAVGHNPISIIIPCHRVIGYNGSLTGYAGGLDKKIALLRHEQVELDNLFIPKEKKKTSHKQK